MAIVKLVQGIHCDIGKHVIPKGGVYVMLPSGRLACPEHQHDEPLIETRLAGAHS
jgi:hypothetical protein